MEDEERRRLERKMKKAMRETEELQEELARATTDAAKRSLASDIEDLERKTKKLRRKLK